MSYTLPTPADDGDRQLIADVQQHGLHIISIEGDEQGPSYSFSVGLTYSYRHPEIVLMGLKHKAAMGIINAIGVRIKNGEKFKPGSICTDIAERYPSAFVTFSKSYYKEYLGYACWFYGSHDFPALQYVWPDQASRFPWDADYDQTHFAHQLILTDDPKKRWPFSSPKNVATIVHASIMNGERPVRFVYHDEDDGGWQFLDGVSPNEPSTARLVCLASVMELDPSLFELANLPVGWRAKRQARGEAWQREQTPPD